MDVGGLGWEDNGSCCLRERARSACKGPEPRSLAWVRRPRVTKSPRSGEEEGGEDEGGGVAVDDRILRNVGNACATTVVPQTTFSYHVKCNAIPLTYLGMKSLLLQ